MLHIYYEDYKTDELGGLDACIRDALNNTIPKDGAFLWNFRCKYTVSHARYRYVNGAFGVIILFDFNNNTERWNINNNEITKV